MALDIGISPLRIGWLAQAPARSEASVWSNCVMLLERVGNDSHVLQRTSVEDFWRTPALASDKLDDIERKLAQHWSDRCSGGEHTVVIPSDAPLGFDVELFMDATGIRGSFGGLAQDFDSVASAMRWVRRALSSTYRLRKVTVGGAPCEWRLERADGGDRADCLEAGQSNLLSWFMTKSVEYRQNTLALDPNI